MLSMRPYLTFGLVTSLFLFAACDCGGSGRTTPPPMTCSDDGDCTMPANPYCVAMNCVQCRDSMDCAGGGTCTDNVCMGGTTDGGGTDDDGGGGPGDDGGGGDGGGGSCTGAAPQCCMGTTTIDAACNGTMYECPAGSTTGACSTSPCGPEPVCCTPAGEPTGVDPFCAGDTWMCEVGMAQDGPACVPAS